MYRIVNLVVLRNDLVGDDNSAAVEEMMTHCEVCEVCGRIIM